MKFPRPWAILYLALFVFLTACADDEPVAVTRLPQPPSATDRLLNANTNDEIRQLALSLTSSMGISGRRLAISSYPRTEGGVDSDSVTRANRMLEENLAPAARLTGNFLVGRGSLISVINSLERDGLGRDMEAFRVRLLENALADVVVVPTYGSNSRGVEMSLIAIEAQSGNALASSGPALLPLGSQFNSWRDRNKRLTQCYQRRQQACILDCTRNYNYGRNQCINVLCSFESDTNMNSWRRVCGYIGAEE
jgi:hypothetical protein